MQIASGAVTENDGQAQNPDTQSAHSGIVTLNTEDGQCEITKFDNDTGRFGEGMPCPRTPVDAHGVPLPIGTINRMRAINKAFAH
jgi:hypothetical protein